MIRVAGIIFILVMGALLIAGLRKMRKMAAKMAQEAFYHHITDERPTKPYRYNQQESRCYPIYKEHQPGDDPRRADEK